MRAVAIGMGAVAATFALACGKSAGPPPTEAWEPTPSAVAPSANVSGAAPSSTPSAKVAPERPADDDTFVVSSQVAGKVGGRGFRVSGLHDQGWSRSGPDGAVLLQLSGPPGGPLGFQIRAYTDGGATIEKQFVAIYSHEPRKPGRTEKVKLAGAERDAQSFRTGESLATSNWCVIRVPSAEGARTGLLILADVGGRIDTEPTCETALRHQAIAPLIASFAIE